MPSEDMGFGYDTFLFAQPVVIQQTCIPVAEFCYYTAECYAVIVIDQYLLDKDDSFFREIGNVGLETTITNLVDDAIQDIQNSTDEYEDIIYEYTNNRLAELSSALYNSLFVMVTSFLMYIPGIINQARRNYKTYSDYRMTSNGDAIVLRLMTRNNNVQYPQIGV